MKIVYIILVFALTTASADFLPQLDNTWDNLLCDGCICTPETIYDCACAQNCPSNTTNYFYIVNLDLLNKLEGKISHMLNTSKPVCAKIEYSLPVYYGAMFEVCIKSANEYLGQYSFCYTVLENANCMSIPVYKDDYAISFNFKIKPDRFSVWQITNLTWT